MTAPYLSLAFAVCALFLWCVVFAPWIALAWFIAACFVMPFTGMRLRKMSE